MKVKKIIVGIFIGILLSVVVICLLMFTNNNSDVSNEFKLNEEVIYKLLDNSYKYYQLKEGHVMVGENQLSNDKTYYSVEEEWLTSFEDVRQLIYNTFSEVRTNNMYNEIVEQKLLIKVEDILYVSIPEEKCEINYNIKKENIKYRMLNEEQVLLDLGVVEIYMYKEADGWRLDANPYSCAFNV